jgi:ribosome modulation factor
MKEEESPYARYYDQGHTAGLAGVPVDQCPYRAVGANRLEMLSRRLAWLEGHSDGLSKRNQAPERLKREKSPATILKLSRAITQRRYQRRALEKKGRPERYVDRRLRQIAADEQQVTPVKRGS